MNTLARSRFARIFVPLLLVLLSFAPLRAQALRQAPPPSNEAAAQQQPSVATPFDTTADEHRQSLDRGKSTCTCSSRFRWRLRSVRRSP
jgi:hypothetical protein